MPSLLRDLAGYLTLLLFPGGSDGKASARNEGDLGSIPELGRSSEEGEFSKIP